MSATAAARAALDAARASHAAAEHAELRAYAEHLAAHLQQLTGLTVRWLEVEQQLRPHTDRHGNSWTAPVQEHRLAVDDLILRFHRDLSAYTPTGPCAPQGTVHLERHCARCDSATASRTTITFLPADPQRWLLCVAAALEEQPPLCADCTTGALNTY